MKRKVLLCNVLFALLLGAVLTGCWGRANEKYVEEDEQAAEELKPLLEPFDPPTLEELEAKVEWESRPVLDALDLMRQRQAGEQPLATVEEALRLRNDSPENNAKILSAMGRMPRSDDEVDYDAVISRHLPVDVKSTNPLMQSSAYEFYVLGLTSFGLFGFDWEFNPFAASATVKSWETSKDRLYDKVVVRDDLVWSDGKPITAHDVAFSFRTIMDPRVPIPAVRSGTDELRWVEAYDDHTLVFFHKEPLATNVWNLNFPVIPRHIYEKSLEEDPTLLDSAHHVRYENDPVVGGPYRITRRSRNQEIVLERREDWYMRDGEQVRPKPYFREVRFQVIEDRNTALLALKNARIEEMELTPEFWVTQTNDEDFYRHNTKAADLEWTTFSFVWNINTPFFADKRVRRAMSYAFNHDEMLKNLLYDLYQPATGIFHPTSRMYPKKEIRPYKQDLDRAEQLLDEAGWADSDGDGIRDKTIGGRTVKFEFSILVPNIQDRVQICTLLKENLDRIGVVCHVRPLEFTVLQEKTQKHEFQAAFGGWGTGADPDTSSNIWTTDAIKNGRNFGEYSNPEVDRLYDQGKREFDPEKRAAIYAKIHEILWEDQPYTWLYYRNAFFGFNRSLRGYVFSPRGPYTYSPGFDNIWKPAQ